MEPHQMYEQQPPRYNYEQPSSYHFTNQQEKLYAQPTQPTRPAQGITIVSAVLQTVLVMLSLFCIVSYYQYFFLIAIACLFINTFFFLSANVFARTFPKIRKGIYIGFTFISSLMLLLFSAGNTYGYEIGMLLFVWVVILALSFGLYHLFKRMRPITI